MGIDFERKPVYANDDVEKYIKTKIIYAGSVITNFHKKVPKEKIPCKCLSIIMLDSVIKANKKYYPQTLLEECKHTKKKKIKTKNYIDDDDLKSDSDTNDETDSGYNGEKEYDNDNDE